MNQKNSIIDEFSENLNIKEEEKLKENEIEVESENPFLNFSNKEQKLLFQMKYFQNDFILIYNKKGLSYQKQRIFQITDLEKIDKFDHIFNEEFNKEDFAKYMVMEFDLYQESKKEEFDVFLKEMKENFIGINNSAKFTHNETLILINKNTKFAGKFISEGLLATLIIPYNKLINIALNVSNEDQKSYWTLEKKNNDFSSSFILNSSVENQKLFIFWNFY